MSSDLINREYLDSQLAEFTNGEHLIQYFGPQFEKNIILFSDLDDYSSIDQLLPRDKSFVIILLENKPSSGHWMSLLRYGNTREFFNSYGMKPTAELSLIPEAMNKRLEQEPSQILDLLNGGVRDNKEIIYSKTKFQKVGSDVGTCGKWCILRCLMLKNFDMNLQDFNEFIKKMKRKYKLSGDQLVSLLIEID